MEPQDFGYVIILALVGIPNLAIGDRAVHESLRRGGVESLEVGNEKCDYLLGKR